jgi:methylisocitrate lyase
VAKVKAAVQARSDPDFVIVARTDAMRTDGYQAGIERARAYMAAGADMIMLFPNTEHETRRAPGDLPGVPLIYVNSEGNRAGRGIYSSAELEGWGWRVVYDAITVINVTARGVREALVRLRRDGSTGLDQAEMIEVRQFVEDVIGLGDLYLIEAATVEQDETPKAGK